MSLRLHVGCGNNIKAGYVNIDAHCTRADVQMDALTISWAYDEGSVDEIYCYHMIEHLSKHEGKKFLRDCYDLLKVGGILDLGLPVVDYVISDFFSGTLSDEHMINTLYGLQRDKFDFHKYGYTSKTIQEDLENLGFEILETKRGRPDYGTKSPSIMIQCRKK